MKKMSDWTPNFRASFWMKRKMLVCCVKSHVFNYLKMDRRMLKYKIRNTEDHSTIYKEGMHIWITCSGLDLLVLL